MNARPWEEGPVVMGVLNYSPESFFDASIYDEIEAAVAAANEMADQGVEIIDIGGESNRPGAELVDEETETKRVVPVVEELDDVDALISVDTWRANVAEAAIEAGADVINDVTGFADPEMKHVAVEHDVPIVIGHSSEIIAERSGESQFDDVVPAVIQNLREKIEEALEYGIDSDQIILDPRIGFGTTEREDIEIIARLEEFQQLGYPLLIGHSRKVTPSLLDGVPTDHLPDHVRSEEEFGAEEMLPATTALTAISVARGADIVRIHDVFENVEAVQIGEIVRSMD